MDHFRHKHSIKVLKTDLTKCTVYNIIEILLKKGYNMGEKCYSELFCF